MFKVVWCFLICFGDVFLKDFPMFFGVLFINIASFVCENKDVGRRIDLFTSSHNLSWNSSFIFLSSRFFTMFIMSFSKFSISSHCGGHFLVLNP